MNTMNFYTDVSSKFIFNHVLLENQTLETYFQNLPKNSLLTPKNAFLLGDKHEKSPDLESLPFEIFYKIICEELSLRDLSVAKKVSRHWNVLANNRLTKVLFFAATQGKNEISKIDRNCFYDYFNIFVPETKPELMELLKKSENCIFAQMLFDICCGSYLSQESKDDQITYIAPVVKRAADKGCVKSLIVLAYLHLYKAVQKNHIGPLTDLELEDKKNNIRDALIYFKKVAQDDFTGYAHYCLGFIYQNIDAEVNEKLALDHYIKSAEKNHSSALFELGYYYAFKEKSSGEEKKLALNYYERAAELNCGNALYALSQSFENGLTTTKNAVVSKKYLLQAAELGHLPSIFKLGEYYFSGEMGFEKNIEKAIQNFQQAAAGNHLLAQRKMCVYYSRGIGVEKNAEIASDLFTKVFLGSMLPDDTFNPKHTFSLGWIHENGIGVKRNLDWAFEFYSEAAESGNPLACFTLGSFYEEGDFVPTDTEKMLEYYQIAANKGYPQAQFKLCQIYSRGFNGNAPDMEKASYYFQLLNVSEHKFDNYGPEKGVRYGNIGCCYREGFGTEKDLERALSYFHMAAKLGHASAQFKLCVYYAENDPKNLEKSNNYFTQLSELYHPENQYRIKERYRNIGYCYANGVGVAQDEKKAAYYRTLENDIGERFLSQTWI